MEQKRSCKEIPTRKYEQVDAIAFIHYYSWKMMENQYLNFLIPSAQPRIENQFFQN